MPRFDLINQNEEQSKQEKWKLSKKSSITSDILNKKGKIINGQVISIIGKNYKVQLEDNNIIECRRAGKITSSHNESQLIATGDNVQIEISEKSFDLSTIVKVEERITHLSRNSIYGDKEDIIAANADKLLIIVAAAEPFFNRRLVDRMLISADIGGLESAICINKIDLMPLDFLQNEFKIYESLGKKVFYISVNDNINITEIQDFTQGNITIFSGQSGVGKSSLLNVLYGEHIQRIFQISNRSGKGQHTTSNATLIKLNEKSAIIDTPGIREFGLWGIEPQELALMFDDFEGYRENCKFIHCTHIHEPKCAVIEAVEEGKIDVQRYQSYLNIFDSLKK